MRVKNYLVSNTFYMFAYTISSSGLNAVFWWLAARLYSPDLVGLAVVLISMAQLLTTTAHLGMNFGLIRFLQETREKGKLLSTVLVTCISLGAGLGLVTILIGPYVSSSLLALHGNLSTAIYFLGLVIFMAIFQLSNPILVAINKADVFFGLSLAILLSRLILLLWGSSTQNSFSLLLAFSVPMFITGSFVLFFYLPRHVPGFSLRLGLDKVLWKKIRDYSLSSFAGNILHDLPYQIIPQVIANFGGLADAAYFYIPWTLSGLVITFSGTLSQSLFIEGATRPASFQRNQTKVLLASLAITSAGIIGLYLVGPFLLALFGPEYANLGMPILRILGLSVLPAAVVYHRVAILRVQNRTGEIIFIYGLILSLWAAFTFGLPIDLTASWISWCWLGAYLVTTPVIFLFRGRVQDAQR
ncbi:MAG: hypothetical protein JXB85_12595 [Anaerolineales bacterium]|nr:hypothetical protein [Anaerolineales bacterium]